MNKVGIAESLKKVLDKEQTHIATNEVIQQSIKIVENLESRGMIDKVKYRLPLTDTIGRAVRKTEVKR